MAGGTVISSQRGMNYKIGGDSREAAELSGVTIDAKTYAFYDTTALNVSGGSNVKAGKAVFGYPAGSSAVVAVNDGVFEASELLDTTDVSGKQITIAGGTFKGMTKDMLENHVAEGATATETDGVVTVGPAEVEEPVAQVGSTTYQSLEEAIEAAGAGQTVTLLRGTELAEAITVDKALTLDLNGCAIATANGKNPSAFTVEAGGNLTVTDSSESETGKIVHEKEETGVLVLVKGGFTLEKGTLDSRSVDTLRVEGGSAVVNGGKVYNRCSFGYNTSRAFRVVTGSGIVNGGLLDCGGRQGYAFSLDENGTAEINGGTVTGNGMAAVLFNKAGTMTITGGTIEQTGSQSNTSAVYYMNSATGKLTVTGGTINSTLYGIYAPVNNAVIEVSDVAITAKQAFCTRRITVSGENTAVKADAVFYTMYIDNSDNLIEGGTFEAGKLVEGTKKEAGEAIFYAWRNGAGYVNKVSGGNFVAPQFAYISGKTVNLQAELTGGTYKGGMTKGELDKYTAKEPKELEAKETETKGVFIIVEKETPVDPTDPIDPTDPTDPTNPTVPTNPTNPTVPTNPTSPSPAAPANPNGGGTRPTGGVTGTAGTAGTGTAGTNATPESAESTEDLIANAGQIEEERVPLNSGSDLEAGTEPSESVPETEEVKDIDEEDVPLAAAAKADGWALLNLLGILIALAAGVLGVFGKSQDDKKKAAEKAAGIVAAVAALVTFVLTQNMTGEVVIADKWTVLMLLYAAAGIVLLGLGKLRKVSRMSNDVCCRG